MEVPYNQSVIVRQIDVLFLLKDAQVWGRGDPDTGRVILIEDRPPVFGDEELLDQAAIYTLQHCGQVFVVEASEMPEPADCLAVLRYDYSLAAQG